MKKIVSLVVLAGFLAFSVGCGGASSSPAKVDPKASTPGKVEPGKVEPVK